MGAGADLGPDADGPRMPVGDWGSSLSQRSAYEAVSETSDHGYPVREHIWERLSEAA